MAVKLIISNSSVTMFMGLAEKLCHSLSVQCRPT